MRSSKCQKSQHSLQGNILAKSNKLTIEVPEEDDDPMLVKLNKNSPNIFKNRNRKQKKHKSKYHSKDKDTIFHQSCEKMLRGFRNSSN